MKGSRKITFINLLNYFIIVYRIFVSHFYTSYSDAHDISYFKDIANCISKKPFELQPEDGFIQKPKQVADLITFNYILIQKNEMDGACIAYGGGERRVQDFGGETRGKKTTWETQAEMGG